MADEGKTASTTTTKERKKRAPMSQAHKDALAQGREQGKAVRAYLEAIESAKPARGRKVSPEQLRERLAEVEEKLNGDIDPVKRVLLIQQRLDLTSRIAATEGESDLAELEKGFVNNAKAWAEAQGVTYTALRDGGVPTPVLKAAGLERRAS